LLLVLLKNHKIKSPKLHMLIDKLQELLEKKCVILSKKKLALII